MLSVAMFAGAYYYWTDTQAFLEVAEITDGEIIRFDESRSDGEIRYTAVIRFTPATGAEIQFTNNTSSNSPSHDIGERVEVIYHPENPRNARINSFFGLYGISTIFGVLGAFGIVFLVATRFSIKRKKALARHLSTYGKPIETQFTGSRRSSRGKNKSPRYYITSTRVQDGTSYEFRSDKFAHNPEHYTEIPETITVIADPRDLSKYIMDTSFLPKDSFRPSISIETGNNRLQF
jgi:hypothetical protein